MNYRRVHGVRRPDVTPSGRLITLPGLSHLTIEDRKAMTLRTAKNTISWLKDMV